MTPLSGANLLHADLSQANLSNADLSQANLTHANLTKANLDSSLILGAGMPTKEEDYPRCENANFENAIIDDEKLSKYLHNSNAKNVPPAVKDKKRTKRQTGENATKEKN